MITRTVVRHTSSLRRWHWRGQAPSAIVDPAPVGHLVAEPGHLPLGVAARLGLDRRPPPRRARYRPARWASELARRRSPSWPAAPGRARAPPAPHFGERRPACDHALGALRDAARGARPRSGASTMRSAFPGSTSGASAPPRCQAASGRPVAVEHFQRAQDARAVGRPDRRGVLRVDAPRGGHAELGVSIAAASAAIVARALGRDRRDRRQSLGQRLEIEPGAADEIAAPAGSRAPRRAPPRIAQPAADRIAGRGRDVAVEPMRRGALVRGAGGRAVTTPTRHRPASSRR